MRGNELRKRWRRTKTLGLGFPRQLSLSLSLFYFVLHTYTLFLFSLPISVLPRHDVKLRRIDAKVYVSSPVVVGCKLCHYSIIHPSPGSMVDERRLSHSNNATAWRKRKRGRKAARTSPEKEGGRGDAKMGEGENITPRVPVIRTRARDDNAKIPGLADDVFVLLSSHDSRSFVFSLSSRLPRPLFLPFPLDIALFFSSTDDAGACLIFARSRRSQL